MAEPRNLANALVILGCLYFLIFAEVGTWGTIGLFFILIFSMSTWGYFHVTDDHKKLLQEQIKEVEARKVNLNAHSQLMMVQGEMFRRTLKQTGR